MLATTQNTNDSKSDTSSQRALRAIMHVADLDKDSSATVRSSIDEHTGRTLRELGFSEWGGLQLGWFENLVGDDFVVFVDPSQTRAVLVKRHGRRSGWTIVSRLSDGTVVTTDSLTRAGMTSGRGWGRRGTMGNLYDDLRGHEMYLHRIQSMRRTYPIRFLQAVDISVSMMDFRVRSTSRLDVMRLMGIAAVFFGAPAAIVAVLGWQLLSIAMG